MAVKTKAERGANAAVPFFRRAIEIDPKFAVAYAELGVTYGDLAQASLAAENLKKAYELRERASEAGEAADYDLLLRIHHRRTGKGSSDLRTVDAKLSP